MFIFIALLSFCVKSNNEIFNNLNNKEIKYIYIGWYNRDTYIKKNIYIKNNDSINYVLSLFRNGKEEQLNRKNTIQDIDVVIAFKKNDLKTINIEITITENNEVYYGAYGRFNPGYRNDSILNFLNKVVF